MGGSAWQLVHFAARSVATSQGIPAPGTAAWPPEEDVPPEELEEEPEELDDEPPPTATGPEDEPPLEPDDEDPPGEGSIAGAAPPLDDEDSCAGPPDEPPDWMTGAPIGVQTPRLPEPELADPLHDATAARGSSDANKPATFIIRNLPNAGSLSTKRAGT